MFYTLAVRDHMDLIDKSVTSEIMKIEGKPQSSVYSHNCVLRLSKTMQNPTVRCLQIVMKNLLSNKDGLLNL